MNNETARKNMELVLQLREASERHSQISQELADQASAIGDEIEAFFQAGEASDDEHDRPVSVQVMDRRETSSFDRLAAAVAEQQDMEEAEKRPPITNSGVRVIRTQRPVEKPGFWTRIASFWTERTPERRLPVGW